MGPLRAAEHLPEPGIVQRRQVLSLGHCTSIRAKYCVSRAAAANLFHGQTARQSSQP